MSDRRYTIICKPESSIIERLPVLEEDVMFYRQSSKQSKKKGNAGRRRTISLGDVGQTPIELHEATPLLLRARLSILLTPPEDQYRRVGKVIGKIVKLDLNYVLSLTNKYKVFHRNS